MLLPTINLPTSVLYILYRLKKNGYEAFLVGGSVRDLLGNALDYYRSEVTIAIDDFDFTTNATPEQTMGVFPKSFYENQYGTVSLPAVELEAELTLPEITTVNADGTDNSSLIPGRIPVAQASRIHESLRLPERPVMVRTAKNYEITTYRVGEKYDLNHRHPSAIAWGARLEDDLTRRDFTINALALTISLPTLKKIFLSPTLEATYNLTTTDYQLLDVYNGLGDLEANLIRAIGEPHKRFAEDALRLMRAVRMSVQLNFAIEEQTYLAI
jgi:tRNA nucleotidyltransferase/poly(A) polymerase